MSDFLGIIGFLAIIAGIFYLGMVWIPDALFTWRPRCFPKCRHFVPLQHGTYRCKHCGWTQRIDSKKTRV